MSDQDISGKEAVILIGSMFGVWLLAGAVFLFIGQTLGFFVGFAGMAVVILVYEIIMIRLSEADGSTDLPKEVEISNEFSLVGSRFETRVIVDGESWRAVLADSNGRVPNVGETAQIIRRDGLALVLKVIE